MTKRFEPSAGLSSKLAPQVFAGVADVRRSGVTILIVEQNVKAALALAKFYLGGAAP